MDKNKVYFWLGIGVKTIDGTDYDSSKPLPVDKIEKKDLKKMIKDGRIGEKIAPVASGSDAAISNLQADIVELKKENKALTKLNAELEATAKTAGEKITELEGKVKELTPEATK